MLGVTEALSNKDVFNFANAENAMTIFKQRVEESRGRRRHRIVATLALQPHPVPFCASEGACDHSPDAMRSIKNAPGRFTILVLPFKRHCFYVTGDLEDGITAGVDD